MTQAFFNLQTCNKEYTNVETSRVLKGTSTPSGGPLQFPWTTTDKILRIPKERLICTPHNPHMKVAHNYNIVDDLSQSPATMSTLEVL